MPSAYEYKRSLRFGESTHEQVFCGCQRTLRHASKGDPSNYHKPYIIKEVQGVRIAILGLTTPGIPNWENAQNYERLEFRETVSEAKKWVPLLRNEGKADVVVVAMHMGIEEDLRTGTRSPSQMTNEKPPRHCASVPGVDTWGNTHRDCLRFCEQRRHQNFMDIRSADVGVLNEGVLLEANVGKVTCHASSCTGKMRTIVWHCWRSRHNNPVTEKTGSSEIGN